MKRWTSLLAAAASLMSSQALAASPASIKLATWNLEWLVAPATITELRDTCSRDGQRPPKGVRSIPCNALGEATRQKADYDALARYAKKLDADVIALQEVDGPDAARLVFPGHRFCFTGRTDLQNTGFAIRAGIPFRCGKDLKALSMGDSVRRGSELVVYPGEKREMRLLSVHLKSGCGERLLDSGRRECAVVARQVPILEDWIDAEARAGRPFAVLGDFNRDLLRDQGAARDANGRLQRLWPEIDDSSPPESDLVNAAEGERFVNCAMNQAYRGYIDYIVLSRSLATRRVPGSFERVTWSTQEALARRLSDHCPVAVRISIAAAPKSRD